jgi:hypothetical protein
MQPTQQSCTSGPSRTPQTSPPELLLVDPELVVEVEADVLETAPLLPVLPAPGPHGFITGIQTLAGLPSTVETGAQAYPVGHAWPLVQSKAQNESPANCPQSLPAPQSCVVTHRVQSGDAPPAPEPAGAPEDVDAPPAPVRAGALPHAAAETERPRASATIPRRRASAAFESIKDMLA